MKWIKTQNVPVKHQPDVVFVPVQNPISLLTPQRESLDIVSEPPIKPLRYHEYEDLPNPRHVVRTLRQTKSLSVTQLSHADKTTPHYSPEEPRYDAEFDEFRTHRDTRRFVRRLHEAMRDFRRIVAPAGEMEGSGLVGGHLTVSTLGTVRFGTDNLTGITTRDGDDDLLDDEDDEDGDADEMDGDADDEYEGDQM